MRICVYIIWKKIHHHRLWRLWQIWAVPGGNLPWEHPSKPSPPLRSSPLHICLTGLQHLIYQRGQGINDSYFGSKLHLIFFFSPVPGVGGQCSTGWWCSGSCWGCCSAGSQSSGCCHSGCCCCCSGCWQCWQQCCRWIYKNQAHLVWFCKTMKGNCSWRIPASVSSLSSFDWWPENGDGHGEESHLGERHRAWICCRRTLLPSWRKEGKKTTCFKCFNSFLTSASVKVDVHHPLLSFYRCSIPLGPRLNLEREISEKLMQEKSPFSVSPSPLSALSPPGPRPPLFGSSTPGAPALRVWPVARLCDS